jgi:transcriptional regulator with XRE-family HTH domain
VTTRKFPRDKQAAIAAARQRAEQTREMLAHKPPPSEILTPQELADAAPFYFVLRQYIQQLKETREAAGFTLADVSARTGMAVEYLSRLETGAQTNPTWKTLGTYANALGRRPQLVLEVATPQVASPTVEAIPARATGTLTQHIRAGEQYIRGTYWGSTSMSVQEPTPAMAG